MRLSDWAKVNNVGYKTARKYFDEGKIPGAYRISERIIIVPDEKTVKQDDVKHVSIYSRVSSHDQKDDLKRQSKRLQEFATKNGYIIDNIIEEIASGMNQDRPKLTKLLKDPKINTIIIENRDRLARMNANLIISAYNGEIIITNNTEPEYNEVQDVIDFMTSFFARQYGKKSAKNRAKQETKRLLKNGEKKCQK